MRPNVRGSTRYSKTFRRSNIRAWGSWSELQGFLAATAITQPPPEAKGWCFRAAVLEFRVIREMKWRESPVEARGSRRRASPGSYQKQGN